MDFTLFLILCYTENAINILLAIFQLFVIIFLFRQLLKPKSPFCSAYFAILNLVYVVDFIFNFFWIYGHLVFYKSSAPFMPLVSFVQWYATTMLGIWEFFLALNRCTAMAFPYLYKRMWIKPLTTLYCLFILSSPIIFHSYIIPNFSCKFLTPSNPSCTDFNIESNRQIAVVNIIFGMLAMILIIIGILFAPKLYNQTIQAKMEKRLIFQTLFSSFFLVFLYGMAYFSWIFPNMEFLVMTHFLYLMQFYPPLFILFLISPMVREEFAKFYGLKRFIKISNNTQISVSKTNVKFISIT